MPARDNSLRELQNEIRRFVASLRHPVVVEDEEELFDLTVARWKLGVEFGKLLLEVWNDARTIGRRVEEIAYRDAGKLGLFVRKPGARETNTLEMRELEPARATKKKAGSLPAPKPPARARSRQNLLALLTRNYPGWKFERVSNLSDREFSFSTWYTRGVARQGRTAWAFVGLGPDEPPAAADAVLAHGLIWLDWLRRCSERVTIGGLKLFLPHHAVELTAHRAAYLNRRALQIEIFDWSAREAQAIPVDLRDFGNVSSHLVHQREGQALIDRHLGLLREFLGDLFDAVQLAADAGVLSLRVHGLEVARVEGQIAPRISFGVEGASRRLNDSSREEFRDYVRSVLEIRHAKGRDRTHDFYRLQSERWLESLLLRDVTKLDPALVPGAVYPQVPAFVGSDRGVIDILAATREGRLAVIELKLDEHINLPMQGLDYWLRVKWLAERGQFQETGYFPGFELAARPPRLYLVAPAFRFHSTTDELLRYFDPSIEVIKVGLNAQWREQIQVLFRRERQGGC
ncbi:MAG: hypothetical protein ACM3NO_08090 [Deltaproteobacteria bacterium]